MTILVKTSIKAWFSYDVPQSSQNTVTAHFLNKQLMLLVLKASIIHLRLLDRDQFRT